MKQWLTVSVFLLLFAGSASAQTTVDLAHYTAGGNPMLVSLPVGSIALSRFETEAPARITSVSIGFYSQETSAADTAWVYILPRQSGGGTFPYAMSTSISPVGIPIDPNTNTIKTINYNNSIEFSQPTAFYIGVRITNNFWVIMDGDMQVPQCLTTEDDTIWTSSFAVPGTNNWSYGYMLNGSTGQTPMNDWYIGVKVQYYDENISTLFTDVTTSAKLHLQASGNTNRRIAWADFNNDGYQDALWGNMLFKNNGDGTFEDVASTVGFTSGSDVNMFADLNNDGFLDILCMPSNALYFNTNGVFQVQPNPGFEESKNTQAMAFIDIDNDSQLEIFVANGEYMYRQDPSNPSDSALVEGAAWQPYFYYNSTAGTSVLNMHSTYMHNYQEGTYGTNPYNTSEQIMGYRAATSAQFVDYDNDGDPDLYVGTDRLQGNYLLEYNGVSSFQFNAHIRGLDGISKTNYAGIYGNTRGFDWGDIDNDGDMDLLSATMVNPFATAWSDPTGIFQNGGSPNYNFSFVNPSESKIYYTDVFQKDLDLGDFNNDGLLDFVITTGENCYPARVYMQNSDHSFTDVTYSAGLSAQYSGGVAWVDYDNDGDLDLSIITEDGLHLYRNNSTSGNWVEFDLEAKTNNHFGVGSRITVFAGGQELIDEVQIGRGAGNQVPLRTHFGLGTITNIDSVHVRWPNGKIDSRLDLAVNTIYTITEYVEPIDTTAVETIATAGKINLEQNYPNPFSKAQSAITSIAYNLPTAAAIRVEIYNTAGALVKVLVDKQQDPGTYYVQWDGRDEMGAQVPSGNYQYLLKSNGTVLSKRMVVLQ